MQIFFVITLITFSSVFPKPLPSTKNHNYIQKEKVQGNDNLNELNADFWEINAKSTLTERLRRSINTNTAKNVILFLGDGMSISSLTAARIYLGQQNKKNGEETFLSFEKFPFSGLIKTYCVNAQVADSGCAATAYLCGVKANKATVGVTAATKLSDCEAMNNETNQVSSVAQLFQLAGKRTGFVTTTRVTHSSPAGLYAHIADKDWETDAKVTASGKDSKQCIDIAQQLIHGNIGRKLNVIFGGGRTSFLPNTVRDEDNNLGWRNDSRNLINEWKQLKRETKHKYVYNLEGMKNLSLDEAYVLGIFDSDHMEFNLDRDTKSKPSLSEMTVKAIEILSQEEKGFFLFVESGRIDHAHHEALTRIALDETIQLHKAIEAAVNISDSDYTLIVVASDHSHAMTFNGYQKRGNNILGIAGIGEDNLPYTTLSYAVGPSGINGSRPDITNDNLEDPHYKFPSYVMRHRSTHGGEDVAIFAKGPWAHLFSGVTEQHVVPYLLGFASRVGNFTDYVQKSGSQNILTFSLLSMLSLTIALF
ncbi:hypothetical protein RN001_014335 [Aquatica leii]|uniref:Alkaline phosphatase n=1 Tax=Aquatica leii TaxID=1421715 RepID=A0AAN7NXC1_9COLE|nr:hypothetical protein RN001_014335 [Aquatica leii]